MFRRSLILGAALLVALTVAPQARAASKPTHKKPPPAPGFVYLSKGLVPGHQYRVEVHASGRVAFTGSAVENFTWVLNHQFGGSSHSVQLNGTTPKSFTITQPVKVKLSSWIMALNVYSLNLKSISVKLLDITPKHKKK